MRPIIRLPAMPEETHFAPLGVLGYWLTRTHFLDPVRKSVRLPLKTVVHPPESKLLDVLVSILAGCRAIQQVNTRLRSDVRWPAPGAASALPNKRRCRVPSIISRPSKSGNCAKAARCCFGGKAAPSVTTLLMIGSGWILTSPRCRPRSMRRPAPKVSSV